MAFSCSTSFVAPPLSTKFVTYVPPANKPEPKPKPTPKAKSMATTKTVEHSRSGIESQDSGEWFRIDDDFTMLDSNASLPTLYEATDASHSVGYGDGCSLVVTNQQNSTSTGLDAFAGFLSESELKNPEHGQFSGKLLDEERPHHPARVAEGDLAIVGPLSGISREFPLVVEDDAAEGHNSATDVEPGNVASDYQEDNYRTSSGNEEYVAVQHSHPDTDEVRALSMEETESLRSNSPLAEDRSLFGGVDVTNRPSITRKRTRPDVLNVTPEPELGDLRPTKRRRPVERLAEHLKRNPVPTPKLTPLSTPSGGVSHSRASTERSLQSIDSSELHAADDGDNGAHNPRASEGPLPSRRAVSPSEGIAGEQNFGTDSERREENREGSGGEFGGSHDELNQDDVLFPRSSAKLPQRRKSSNRPLEGKKHGPSRTTRRPRSSSTMLRASRQITPSQAQQPYWPVIDEEFQSCSLPTSSRGTKTGNELNINHNHSVDMAYQITDLTLCAVPNGSSIVTAVIRYRDSKWPLDPAVLGPRFLGRNSKVIRMTQLLPDSWMLLGYWCDNDAVVLCNRGSLDVERIGNCKNDAAGHGTDHSDDDWDEEDKHREQDIHRYSSRTHIAWPLSDEARLLSYKDKQGMEWKEIFKRFPDRTTGAVRTRYHKLRTEGQ
ncbi:hypothetical protein EKO04_009147 [Ascochyta lentis]|uniref:Myb-like domain-containing protein n=1 Tax=Ascochyta lentis TaxID=205686 RepID=A0A8H7IX46_9PLEO|nr:hypothetical protein EKO04_009147 [Ascochyta lentis]